MHERDVQRIQLVGVVLLIALQLLVAPFGHVHFEGWTLELEHPPHAGWVIGICLVSTAIVILFAFITKKVLDSLHTAAPDIRTTLRPAAWASASVAAFAVCEALFALATLSTPIFNTIRVPLAVVLAVSLLSLAAWTTVFTRRLRNEGIKGEWERVFIRS